MIKLVVVGVVLIIALAVLVRLVEARFAFFPSVGDTPPPAEPGLEITPWSVTTRDGGDSLRDLKFEYRAGKFAEQDYEQMKDALENEAALVLAEIESLTGNEARPVRRDPAVPAGGAAGESRS